MDLNQIREPLERFRQELTKTITVDDLIVFGSYAKGTATPESDVDVVVVSKDFAKLREDKRWQVLDRACVNLEPDIQAWGFTPTELEQAGDLSTLGQARKFGVHL